jgi:hypothetical protein
MMQLATELVIAVALWLRRSGRHRQNSQEQPTKASDYTINPHIPDCNDHNQLDPIRPE